MCGFAGTFNYKTDSDSIRQTLLKMGAQLAHRGPDDEGCWTGLDIGLVHRRLSIQDLSPEGAQPMISHSGRFVIAFNGEIYNFLDLRKELEKNGFAFRGHSDTEVMLASFEYWGIEESLNRFNGMFAFALVDQREKKLFLCRDRMGEKPLYYGWQGHVLVFGSELKPLRVHPAWNAGINRNALTLLLRHNFIPAPHCIYSGILKLPPASFVSFDLTVRQPHMPKPIRYWNLSEAFNPEPGYTTGTAADELEKQLETVIREQMISDVPLGAFLSGGIDSSTVVALMQKLASQPVRTFSIGFTESGFNEAEHARAVASHLGTKHTELYVSPDDAMELIPNLPRYYDEPFADSSQLPTCLISRMTRQHVTVALSGDGGDELFCGYPRYFSILDAWKHRHHWKQQISNGVSLLPAEFLAKLIQITVPGQGKRSGITLVERIQKEANLARAKSLPEYYRHKVSYWTRPEQVVIDSVEPDYALKQAVPAEIAVDPLKTMMWMDLNWYLPDDILVKVDRAAMASSLETRIPLLDRRIVELVLGLPTELNVNANTNKQVLREVLYRHVPRELVERPKQGFAVPLEHWLRSSLRDWAEALLDPQRLREEGYLNPLPIRRLWQAHIAGQDDHSFLLWGILMFQTWLEYEKEQLVSVN